MNEPDDELLEYETEAEEEDARPLPIDPVPVKISEPVVTVETVPQHVSMFTLTLTAETPMLPLLPLDPLRVSAQVLRVDNHFILCHSLQQAMDPLNITPAATDANGALVTATFNAPVPVRGTQAVWVATRVFPTRVGVIVERRSA